MTAPVFTDADLAAQGFTDTVAAGIDGMEAPVDPEAPYGRKADGTPYKMPPEQRAKVGAILAQGRANAAATGRPSRRRPAARKAAAGPGRKAAAPPPPSYATMAAGMMQIPAMVLGVLSRFWPSLAYDSVAVSYHTPPIARAVEQMALQDARWAAVLEKAATVGPWGEFTMACLPLVMQIAANHQYIPSNPDFGILAPEDLMKAAGIDAGTDDQPG